MQEKQPEENKETIQRKALVFISHDSRDSSLAEAFSKLLSSVSAGVLKSFRSSDKKGTQGIEYGVEWYPEIMKKLQDATDVVCLLTKNSLNRPWILFEAGVAKGKVDTPILGVGIGIPLGKANDGPFAQFQNCGDDDDSLIKLVTQLVRKIPNSEPDEEVIRTQVKRFKEKIAPMLGAIEEHNDSSNNESKDGTNVANLYEEIKIMFQDLPSKIGGNLITKQERPLKKAPPRELDLVIHELSSFRLDFAIIASLGFLKEEFPWVYDIGIETLKIIKSGNRRNSIEAIKAFDSIITHTVFRGENYNEYEDFQFYILRRLSDMFTEQLDESTRGKGNKVVDRC